jgi:hypothetical protein
LTLTDK